MPLPMHFSISSITIINNYLERLWMVEHVKEYPKFIIMLITWRLLSMRIHSTSLSHNKIIEHFNDLKLISIFSGPTDIKTILI